jgi:N-carbamoyl-L-amino-acid hydrolase
MLARVCPTGMIFTQSHKGISHNPAEHTAPQDLIAATDILMDVMWSLAHTDFAGGHS